MTANLKQNTRNALLEVAADNGKTITKHGSDREALDQLASLCGVTVNFHGNDDEYLARIVAAIAED